MWLALRGPWVTQSGGRTWRTERSRLPSGFRLSGEPEGVHSFLGVGSLARASPSCRVAPSSVTDQVSNAGLRPTSGARRGPQLPLRVQAGGLAAHRVGPMGRGPGGS